MTQPHSHPPALPATPAAPRHDGWTPERQRIFLATLAETGTVDAAAKAVGLSASSAYQFRRRAQGGVFHLGWEAALLHARRRLADTLMSRAFDGQEDTVTRGDVTYTRHRYDNRLALSLLGRLDRLTCEDKGEAPAARLIAQEFDQYLDLVESGAGSARAGLFLAARTMPADGAVPLTDPVHTLMRADLYERIGVGLASEIDTHDLDLADRASWSAEQWQRAEAAGLLALAVPAPPQPHDPEPHDPEPHDPEQCEVREDRDPSYADRTDIERIIADGEPPVWRDGDREHLRQWHADDYSEWHTCFPPPPGFDGDEIGRYGDDHYYRTLSPEETAMMNRIQGAESAHIEARDSAARDEWFGFAPAVPADAADTPAALEGLATSDVLLRRQEPRVTQDDVRDPGPLPTQEHMSEQHPPCPATPCLPAKDAPPPDPFPAIRVRALL